MLHTYKYANVFAYFQFNFAQRRKRQVAPHAAHTHCEASLGRRLNEPEVFYAAQLAVLWQSAYVCVSHMCAAICVFVCQYVCLPGLLHANAQILEQSRSLYLLDSCQFHTL